MPIDPTQQLGSTGDITPPAYLHVETPEQLDLYRASAEFERFFVQHMMKQMDAATKALSGGDDAEGAAPGSAGMSGYKDMVQDQMVQAVLDGGGLGLAGVLYQQMGEQSGMLPPTTPVSRDRAGGAA